MKLNSVVTVVLVVLLSACSNSAADSPYGNPYVILKEELVDARYVFIATVSAEDLAGHVVLNPVLILNGDLPVDSEGHIRLEGDHEYRSCTGVWLLDEDLQPIDDLDTLHPLLDANPMPIVRSVLLEVFPEVRLPESYPAECEGRL